MRISPLALLPLVLAVLPKSSHALEPIRIFEGDEFGEPDWEFILERAFPTWAEPENGCPRLSNLGGSMPEGYDKFPTAEDKKFNPCYYTKAFAGLDPSKGGYPTPIDTHYPYEFAAPFHGQPGDGSVHHCPLDSENTVAIPSCPKLGNTCGKDCAQITAEYGIGHIPPFVPLAAIKNEYMANETDICAEWFHYETSQCSIKKSALDEMVYKHFGEDDKIKFQPPVLIDGKPSSTYYRLEFIGSAPECDGNCFGPHYCTSDVADDGKIWGDFCPYVHTGENSGKYRHPHLALAALELWIANQCMPDKCPSEWLDSPHGKDYGKDEKLSTSITWSEMKDNSDPMSQPMVPYAWPNSGDGIYPGLELYNKKTVKSAPGLYVTEFVGGVDVDSDNPDDSAAAIESVAVTFAALFGGVMAMVL
mmetsp:Transcript_3789/g.5459  ORF Transcript_3789/g.5459 Transcript_3789/m.5459 type:complete len:418 (-) Transcript_3789:1939-3192(-)